MQEVLLALWLERKFKQDADPRALSEPRLFRRRRLWRRRGGAPLFRQVGAGRHARGSGDARRPPQGAVAAFADAQLDGAQKRAQVVLAAMADAGSSAREARSRSRIAAAHVAQWPAAARNYVADWVMDVLPNYVGHDRRGHHRRHHHRLPSCRPRPRRRSPRHSTQDGAKFDVEQGALVAMTPGRRGARRWSAGATTAESQFNRAVDAQPPARLGVQAVRLSDRARTRADARHDPRRPADVDRRAGSRRTTPREYHGPVTLTDGARRCRSTRCRCGSPPEVGPQAVAATAHRLGITSPLSRRLDRARHVGSDAAGAGRRLCALRQWRHGVIPHVIERITTAATARCSTSGSDAAARPHHRPALRRHDELDAARRRVTNGTGARRELPGWPAAGKTGTRRISATPGSSATPAL